MTWRWKVPYPIPVPWVSRVLLQWAFCAALKDAVALLLSSTACELWLKQCSAFHKLFSYGPLFISKGMVAHNCSLELYFAYTLLWLLSPWKVKSLLKPGHCPTHSRVWVSGYQTWVSIGCESKANYFYFHFVPFLQQCGSVIPGSWYYFSQGSYLNTCKKATVCNILV